MNGIQTQTATSSSAPSRYELTLSVRFLLQVDFENELIWIVFLLSVPYGVAGYTSEMQKMDKHTVVQYNKQ